MEGVDQIIVKGDALPEFDVQCSLLSLPLAFGTVLESIPARVPYLWADAGLAKSLAAKLGGVGSPRVGLVWAGRPKPDPLRSAKLHELAALWEVGGVNFVSLQMGTARDEVKRLPSGSAVVDVSDQVSDFADTAAVIANLDLVISIDTAVAHLAGAMGKPVWVILPFLPSWRWLLNRDDSPWYPTARLFRQTSPGDWRGVAAEVSLELGKWVKGIRPG
jgi:hypothetical protein